jgi:hypothetical protein
MLFNLLLWPAGLFLVIYFALYITGWFSGGVCTSKRRLDGKFVVITGISSKYCFEIFKNNQLLSYSADPTTNSETTNSNFRESLFYTGLDVDLLNLIGGFVIL